MHYLMLITITLPLAATSADVRNITSERLQSDPTFCGEGGRFGNPLCDWFVIGGRWSGYLRESVFGAAYRQAIDVECPELAGTFYETSAVGRNREKLDELWRRFGGRNDSPYLRDPYHHLGYEDDAMPVDQIIFDALLAKYAGDSQDGHHFADLDDEPVDKSFVGRKWLVVIDYHN